MPPLEHNRRGPELNGIDHREPPPTDKTLIGFAITNPNASRRQGLSRRMPQSFRLQSANSWYVFPERSTIKSNLIGDRYAFA
jgi:hypothetical protein